MKNEELKAVEMTREIRDRMYDETKGLERDDFLRYVQQRSAAAEKKVEEREAAEAGGSQRMTHR